MDELTKDVKLSPMDAVMANFFLKVLYIFPPRQDGEKYDASHVRSSFVQLIDEDYSTFLGILSYDHDRRAYVVQQTTEQAKTGAKDLPFILDPESESTSSEAVDSMDTSFASDLDESKYLISIKMTPLRDKGMVIGISVSHTLMDGQALFTFMKKWGEFYRQVPKEAHTQVVHDRSLLFAQTNGAYQLDHPEFKIVKKTNESSNPSSTALPSTTQKLFHLSSTDMIILKANVVKHVSEGYVSTIDVITALFTLLITQARGHGHDIKITTGVNGRTRLNPPLPKGYVGNVIFNALSTYSSQELMDTRIESIATIARRIRESILQRDDMYMRDAIEFLGAQEDVTEIQVGMDFFLGHDLMFTSWVNMGTYDANFGAHPWYGCTPRVPVLDGMSIIMEGVKGQDGVDVLVLLETEAMERLSELWSKVEFRDK